MSVWVAQARGKKALGLTSAVVLVVQLAPHEGRQLLEVFLGLVERVLEGAQLLVLVGAPERLVRLVQEQDALVEQVRDGSQQSPDGVEAHCSAVSAAVIGGRTGSAFFLGRGGIGPRGSSFSYGGGPGGRPAGVGMQGHTNREGRRWNMNGARCGYVVLRTC